MAPALLSLSDIHLTFGGVPLLEGASLNVEPGDRICLVGRNGSGKSTLLKIAAGLVDPDRGERFRQPGADIRYLAQEPDLDGFVTARDYVAAGLSADQSIHEAAIILEELGLNGSTPTATMSGGEGRRAAIARALVGTPDVLLLDEPTNHLDIHAIEALEKRLNALRSAVVLISHDRRFLENLSRKTVWIDRGQTRFLDASFKSFEAWRDKVLEEEETERHKLDRKIAREDQWMHGGVTARRKRNVRRVRELAELRKERREQRHVSGNVRLATADSGMSSRLIVEARSISKTLGGRALVSEFSTTILRGDRLALVGPNGVGKTTLLKMLTGQLAPDSGHVRLGQSLNLVTLDQRRDELNPDWSLMEALTGGRGDQVVINGKARHVASYMKDFLFTSQQMRSPVRVLSGGERGRLMLARALAKPSNVLVLDEPTNDLDLETLDLLQELLAEYPGTVLLVSHDRDFLDRVATSVIVAEGGGRWVEYAGGYSDMLAQRRHILPTTEGLPPTKRATTAPPTAAAAAPVRPRRKLSYKDQLALDTLPARIDALGAERTRLEAQLADPTLYVRDPVTFAGLSKRLETLSVELASAEDQWLELELRRADLES